MLSWIQRTKTLAATLATIDQYIVSGEFSHIVSLNPENIMICQTNDDARHAFERAQITIADGAGVVIAARLWGIPIGDRITGVDLMEAIVSTHRDKDMLFVGGYDGVAQQTCEILRSTYSLKGRLDALSDVSRDDPALIQKILEAAPQILFVAFGSPYQEIWIDKHRSQLQGVVCMGVGQAFDVCAGKVMRAPTWVRRLGCEWLFRLITQPWRWRRQMRLLQFILFIVRGRIRGTLT